MNKTLLFMYDINVILMTLNDNAIANMLIIALRGLKPISKNL